MLIGVHLLKSCSSTPRRTNTAEIYLGLIVGRKSQNEKSMKQPQMVKFKQCKKAQSLKKQAIGAIFWTA